MKPVQIMMDEQVLAAFDADQEVQKKGRSAILRQIIREYLRHRHQVNIAREYQAAYGQNPGVDEEFAGWEEEGAWPSE